MAKTHLRHFKTGPDTPVRAVTRVVIAAGVKTIIDTEGLSTEWSQVTFCQADGAALESANKTPTLRAKLIDPAPPEGAAKVAAKAAQHAKQKERE